MAFTATLYLCYIFFENVFQCLQLTSLLLIALTWSHLSFGIFEFLLDHSMNIFHLFGVSMLWNLKCFNLLLDYFGQILGVL